MVVAASMVEDPPVEMEEFQEKESTAACFHKS